MVGFPSADILCECRADHVLVLTVLNGGYQLQFPYYPESTMKVARISLLSPAGLEAASGTAEASETSVSCVGDGFLTSSIRLNFLFAIFSLVTLFL